MKIRYLNLFPLIYIKFHLYSQIIIEKNNFSPVPQIYGQGFKISNVAEWEDNLNYVLLDLGQLPPPPNSLYDIKQAWNKIFFSRFQIPALNHSFSRAVQSYGSRAVAAYIVDIMSTLTYF